MIREDTTKQEVLMSIQGGFGINPFSNFNQTKSIATMSKQEIVSNYNEAKDVSIKLQMVKDLCNHAQQMGDTKEARNLFMIAASLTLDTSTGAHNETTRNFLHSALFEMVSGNRDTFDKFHSAVTSAKVIKDIEGSSYKELLESYIK